jgi:cytochrome c oxidase subunit 1
VDAVATARPALSPPPSLSRRLHEWGLLLGVIGAIVGFVVGWGIGSVAIAFTQATDNSLGSDAGILLGYALSAVGFLAGMGFLNYPVARLLGRPRPTEEDNAYLHGEGGGLSKYFRMTTDHKVIGMQYLVMILAFLFLGGLGAMFIRSELLTPTPSVANAGTYLTLVGLHSTLMIFMASTAIIGPFGNYFVPIMIGSRNMAFPRLEALTFWLLPPAGIILLSTVFLGGFPTGWTGYAPLSNQAVAGMDSYLLSFGLIGLSIALSGLNMIATIFTKRAPGMSLTRMPIFVWSVLVTSFLGLLAAPALIGAVLMETIDRTYQTTFFVPAGGGSPYLWENLFWFFGHPEVYIFIVPAFGLIMEMLPVFARRPLWGYRVGVGGMVGVGLLSFMVWQHHLFTSGIAPALRPFYMFSTEMISVPTGIIFLVALGTLWRARVRFTIPMLFIFAFFFNFLIGGFTGVFLSDVPSDFTLHASYFVQAHFHYTIMGSEVFALMGAIVYYLPKMTGVSMDTKWLKFQFWAVFLTFNGTFLSLVAVGILGMPRRVISYAAYLQPLNISASVFAFGLGASMSLFLGILIWKAVFQRVPAAANPWESLGIEWQVPTPVPVFNFDTVPTSWALPYDYDTGRPAALIPASVAPALGGA